MALIFQNKLTITEWMGFKREETSALSIELRVHHYNYITPVNDALSAERWVQIIMPQKVYPGEKAVL